MNIKRAFGIGLVNYLVSVVISLAIGTSLGFDFENSADFPPEMLLLGAIAVIIVTPILTYWYFSPQKVKGKKIKRIKPSMNNGLQLGIVFVIVGFVLDGVIIGASVASGTAPVDPFAFYSNLAFWLTLLLVVVMAGISGSVLASKLVK